MALGRDSKGEISQKKKKKKSYRVTGGSWNSCVHVNYLESEGSFMSQERRGGRGRGKRNYMESNYVAGGSVTDHHCTSARSFLLSFPLSSLPSLPLFLLPLTILSYFFSSHPPFPPVVLPYPVSFCTPCYTRCSPPFASPAILTSGTPWVHEKGQRRRNRRHYIISSATRPRSIWLDKRG